MSTMSTNYMNLNVRTEKLYRKLPCILRTRLICSMPGVQEMLHYLPPMPLRPSLGGIRHSAFTTVRGITARRHFNAPRLVAALGDEDSDAPLGGRLSTWRPDSPTMATRPEENNDAAATVFQTKAAVVVMDCPAAERHRVKANPNARLAALPKRVHRMAILLPGSLPGKRRRRTTARRVPLEFSISGGNGGSSVSRGRGSVGAEFAPTRPIARSSTALVRLPRKTVTYVFKYGLAGTQMAVLCLCKLASLLLLRVGRRPSLVLSCVALMP